MTDAFTGACTPSPQGGEGAGGVWRRVLQVHFCNVSSIVRSSLAIAAAWWWIASLGPAPLGEGLSLSTLVVDRDGKLLRPYATPRRPLAAAGDARGCRSALPRYAVRLRGQAFPASHHGVDPLALGRAVVQFVRNGQTVSGGSTLTMQVARLLEPRERTLLAKLRQIVRAIEIERKLCKDEVLALYLSLAPYGGNLEGIRAASLAYFGKEPRRLTLAESALLVALPQSPEQRRPDRSMDTARHARDRVLDRIAAAGLVPADEVARAKAEPVPERRKPMPMLAPHAADAVVAAAPGRSFHRLTIDAALQKNLEDLARERARALGPDMSVAILAVDNATGEVLARVASADYFDATPRRPGRHDAGAALARLDAQAVHLWARLRGRFDPSRDADRGPAGALRQLRAGEFRSHLPGHGDGAPRAADVAQRAGGGGARQGRRQPLHRAPSCRRAARLVLPKGEAPGLAMGLGGVGVTLTDLVMLYAGLARLGTAVPLIERVAMASEPAAPRRLMDPVAAWYVGNVLLGTPPPENAAGGRIAFKTGTSYGYRDAWSVGFDGKRTIGVWVGRPDGAPVPGLVGRAAAAPILFDAFARTGKLPAPLPSAPKGALVAATGKLPPPLQRFRPGPLAGRGRRAAAAHHVPAQRRAARTRERRRRQTRSDRAQGRGRLRAADRAGQRPAAAGRAPAGARCSSSPKVRASCGSP